VRKLKTARRDEIVDAAMDLAGEKGLDAVSMRAVAGRIELTPMALYGYFRNKEDLLDAVVGRLLSLMPEPDPEQEPLERLKTLARGVRMVGKEHPAVVPLLLTRPAVTEEAVRTVDGIYAALLDAGVPDGHVARLERLLSTFVLGYVVSETQTRFSPGSRTLRGRRAELSPGELPAHHRLTSLLDPPVDWDAEFEADLADLAALVAGIAAG
jgi:AcrR family transcriptional regulator